MRSVSVRALITGMCAVLLAAVAPSAGAESPIAGEAEKAALAERASAVGTELETSYPDIYGGVEIRENGTVFQFVGRPPLEAMELVRSVPGSVTVEQVPFSHQKLQEVQLAAYQQVWDSGRIVNAVSFVDVSSGMISISFEPVRAADVPALEGYFRDAVVAGPEGMTISLVAEDVAGEAEVIIGGGSMSSCTSGFVVTYGGVRGLLTAHHCGGSQKYEGRSVLSNFTFSDPSWDVAVYRNLGEASQGRFRYSTSGQTRAVIGYATPAVNANTCHYGKTTDYSCDQVYKTGVCANGYCGLTAAKTYTSAGGDSGGPWFFGSTAHGVHHGWTTISGVKRSLFTPIKIARAALPISLVLG